MVAPAQPSGVPLPGGPVAGLESCSCPGMPHVAFVVDDLSGARVGDESPIAPDHPAEGVTAASIVDDGAQLSSSSSIRKRRKDARFGHESPV